MKNLKQLIKNKYRNGPDNIGKDFISPALKNSILYRRGTGFFSSGALIAYADSMNHLIEENTKIQIICSPVIHDKTLLSILKNNITDEQRKKTIEKLSNSVVLKALGYKLNTERRDYKKDLLAYFIAKSIIEIRFAVPRNFKDVEINNLIEQDEKYDLTNNLYHVKTGYFKITDGSIIGFDGSFNESDSGHQYHIDQTQVWRSWVENDRERLTDLVETIDSDWNGTNPYIEVFKMDEEAIELANRLSTPNRPQKSEYEQKKEQITSVITSEINQLREYQKEALNNWKDSKYHGIFAMATGTGKTRTAIEAIKNFTQKIKNSLVVITVPYRPLAYQWVKELNKFELQTIEVFDGIDRWERKLENLLEAHINNLVGSGKLPIIVCVNKTFKGQVFQNHLDRLSRHQTEKLIIVDECHHFNKVKSIKTLPNSFAYRMGLSATPYEADEERILSRYFGEIIYEFSLHRAIKEGFLCKYNYHPIFIELSTEEVGKYLAINDLIQRKKEYINEEEYESSVEEYNELDRMLETVVAKLSALENIITKEVDKHYSLFYCGTGSVELANGEKVRQINSLSRMLDSLGWKVTKITADEKPAEREAIFASFKRKEVDAIASIRVLDEGIDIPDCRTAYILASQKSERQGIQRRGRILRNSPGKMIANLYDFIITGPKLSNSDLDKLYMRELSRAKLFAKDAVNKELCTFEIEQY